ncbi:MAG TPA: hypothetical protein VF988_03560, partial [Verrucomicrobiae bacterium]
MKLKLLKGVAMSAAVSLLAGCIVLSVYPFYLAKDLIADPGLAGRWARLGRPNETWTIAASGPKAFILTTVDESSTNGFEAHVFQLEQHQFLDLLTTNRTDPFTLPLHLIAKFNRDDTNLTLPFMDYGWLTRFLETNQSVVGHIVVPEHPGDTNSQMVY